jgi:hypothetical protein
MTVAAATSAFGWHTGKLTRIEQGAVPVRDVDLDKCFEVYGIPKSEHNGSPRRSPCGDGGWPSLCGPDGDGAVPGS